MPTRPIDAEMRDEAWGALLGRHPEAVVAALGPDGFRVPMPARVGLAEHQVIPVPVDRATMVDLVVPADGMKVITTWERACQRGIAVELVRTRNDPDRTLSLVFVDQRHRHGVWLAALTDPTSGSDQAPDNTLPPFLTIPLRPRTATMRKNWHAIVQEIDGRTTRMLGWNADEIVGHRSTEFIHPEDQERAVAGWMELLSKREGQRVRLRHRCRDGGWLWVEIENSYHGGDDPGNVEVVSQLTDISDEMAAYEALDGRERLLRRLAESLPIGLLQLEPDGSLVYANARVAEILGVGRAPTVDELLATVVEADRPSLDAALHEVLEKGTDQELEVDIRLPATRVLRRCSLIMTALTDQEGAPGALACVSDVTESARMRDELRARATYDTLTGCHNRASVIAALDRALAAGGERPVAVVFIDLDGFKTVNDTLGHAAGDELLVHAANLLTGVLREGDIVGRLGGDEFLLLCPGIGAPAEALDIAGRAGRALRREVPLSAGTATLSASIGVVCAQPGTASDAAIGQADAAMYRAKRHRTGEPVLHGSG